MGGHRGVLALHLRLGLARRREVRTLGFANGVHPFLVCGVASPPPHVAVDGHDRQWLALRQGADDAIDRDPAELECVQVRLERFERPIVNRATDPISDGGRRRMTETCMGLLLEERRCRMRRSEYRTTLRLRAIFVKSHIWRRRLSTSKPS